MKFTICMILVISHFVLGMIGLIYSNVRNNVDNSFKLNGNNKVTVVYGETYNDEGYSIDLNDSNKANIKTANTVDTTKVGDYEVIWKATDKSKNTSEKKVIVHVKEKKIYSMLRFLFQNKD